MNILLIGGTIFLGPAICRSLYSSQLNSDGNLTITLFYRGTHKPSAQFESEINDWVESGKMNIVYGDRLSDLHKLDDIQPAKDSIQSTDKQWSAVIDTCGYHPSTMEISCAYFKERTNVYLFVSTCSVYASLADDEITENNEAIPIPEQIPEFGMEYYGLLKRACEITVDSHFRTDDNSVAINLRPGLIVGEDDPTDRFTYWVWRVLKARMNGSAMLVPSGLSQYVQYIDVRDCADSISQLLTQYLLPSTDSTNPIRDITNSAWNCVTPIGSATLNDILITSSELIDELISENRIGSDVKIHPLEYSIKENTLLLEQGVAPWGDLPLWIPAELEDLRGIHLMSPQKLMNTGFGFRSLRETIKPILLRVLNRLNENPNLALRSGLSSEREGELLSM
jgi:2'-hydroxyisoflavone reductase